MLTNGHKSASVSVRAIPLANVTGEQLHRHTQAHGSKAIFYFQNTLYTRSVLG